MTAHVEEWGCKSVADATSGLVTGEYDIAMGLVARGYSTIRGTFSAAKARGVIPKGRSMAEMIHSNDWTQPPLLTPDRYREFCLATDRHLPHEVLALIWYILEHMHNERRLMPCMKIDRHTGELAVYLTL